MPSQNSTVEATQEYGSASRIDRASPKVGVTRIDSKAAVAICHRLNSCDDNTNPKKVLEIVEPLLETFRAIEEDAKHGSNGSFEAFYKAGISKAINNLSSYVISTHGGKIFGELQFRLFLTLYNICDTVVSCLTETNDVNEYVHAALLLYDQNKNGSASVLDLMHTLMHMTIAATDQSSFKKHTNTYVQEALTVLDVQRQAPTAINRLLVALHMVKGSNFRHILKDVSATSKSTTMEFAHVVQMCFDVPTQLNVIDVTFRLGTMSTSKKSGLNKDYKFDHGGFRKDILRQFSGNIQCVWDMCWGHGTTKTLFDVKKNSTYVRCVRAIVAHVNEQVSKGRVFSLPCVKADLSWIDGQPVTIAEADNKSQLWLDVNDSSLSFLIPKTMEWISANLSTVKDIKLIPSGAASDKNVFVNVTFKPNDNMNSLECCLGEWLIGEKEDGNITQKITPENAYITFTFIRNKLDEIKKLIRVVKCESCNLKPKMATSQMNISCIVQNRNKNDKKAASISKESNKVSNQSKVEFRSSLSTPPKQTQTHGHNIVKSKHFSVPKVPERLENKENDSNLSTRVGGKTVDNANEIVMKQIRTTDVKQLPTTTKTKRLGSVEVNNVDKGLVNSKMDKSLHQLGDNKRNSTRQNKTIIRSAKQDCSNGSTSIVKGSPKSKSTSSSSGLLKRKRTNTSKRDKVDRAIAKKHRKFDDVASVSTKTSKRSKKKKRSILISNIESSHGSDIRRRKSRLTELTDESEGGSDFGSIPTIAKNIEDGQAIKSSRVSTFKHSVEGSISSSVLSDMSFNDKTTIKELEQITCKHFPELHQKFFDRSNTRRWHKSGKKPKWKKHSLLVALNNQKKELNRSSVTEKGGHTESPEETLPTKGKKLTTKIPGKSKLSQRLEVQENKQFTNSSPSPANDQNKSVRSHLPSSHAIKNDSGSLRTGQIYPQDTSNNVDPSAQIHVEKLKQASTDLPSKEPEKDQDKMVTSPGSVGGSQGSPSVNEQNCKRVHEKSRASILKPEPKRPSLLRECRKNPPEAEAKINLVCRDEVRKTLFDESTINSYVSSLSSKGKKSRPKTTNTGADSAKFCSGFTDDGKHSDSMALQIAGNESREVAEMSVSSISHDSKEKSYSSFARDIIEIFSAKKNTEEADSQKAHILETFIKRHLRQTKTERYTKTDHQTSYSRNADGALPLNLPSNRTSSFDQVIQHSSSKSNDSRKKKSKKRKSEQRNIRFHLSQLQDIGSIQNGKTPASKKQPKLNILSKTRGNSKQKQKLLPTNVRKLLKMFRKKLRKTTKRTIKKASLFLEEYKKEKLAIVSTLIELLRTKKVERLQSFKNEQAKRTEIIKSYMDQLIANQDEMNQLEMKHATHKADFEKAYEAHKAQSEMHNSKHLQLFKELKEEAWQAETGLAARVAELKKFTGRKIAGLKRTQHNADKQAQSFREKISLFSSL